MSRVLSMPPAWVMNPPTVVTSLAELHHTLEASMSPSSVMAPNVLVSLRVLLSVPESHTWCSLDEVDRTQMV